MSRTQSSASGAQVLVVADDPVEAGMLALDLVQAGVTAQAVRDADTAAELLLTFGAGVAAVVVAAYRDLARTVELSERLSALPRPPAFVAVVLRSQREAAVKHVDAAGWTGVAVRPVNAEELVGLVRHVADSNDRPQGEARLGELHTEGLLDLLGKLMDRIPRPGMGKSALLHLESAGRTGLVALLDGELVHAEVDGETGRHSLERMACWRSGSYRVETAKWSGPSTLSGPALALFAVAQEYGRRVEEARQSLPYTDCVCSVRWERVRPLPVVAEALFRRIASGTVLADALGGDGDDELEAFAALEARIRRGAVVPQVETGPRAADLSGTLGGVDGSARPVLDTRNPAAKRASSHAWPAAPMTMVDAPQMPERRHSHPTTHVYRVGVDDAIKRADGAVTGGAAAADPLAASGDHSGQLQDSVPLAMPDRSALRGPTPLQVGGIARRAPSSLLATAARSDGGAAGGRNSPVSGWFGVQSTGEQRFPETEATYNPRHGTSSRVLAAGQAGGDDRLTAVRQLPGAGSQDQRLAARPYAWIPAAQLEEEAVEPPPPKPMALLQPKNWPWVLLAASALVAGIWLAMPGPKQDEQLAANARGYLDAVALVDGGHSEQALAQLQKLRDQPDFVAEVLLHMAVLQLEAKQPAAAKAALSAYLAHPQARHQVRAKRLFDHWFGAPGKS